MPFARILLAITGLVFFVHGLVCFIHPATIGIESGLAMPTPSSVIEVRAEHGGLPIALGLFFLAAALQKIEARTGLIVMVTAVAGYATARIAAVVIAGDIDTYNTAAILYEVTTASLGAWALRRSGRGRHAAHSRESDTRITGGGGRAV
jgi:predicted anti-sigma-YlaC factor YlaD